MALWAFPPLPLTKDKGINPLIPYQGQVFKHAHAVPGAVPLIKVTQPATGRSARTELPHPLHTIPDNAGSAVRGFGRRTPATGTDPLLAQETAAQGTVHPAGSDHLRNNGVNTYLFHNSPRKQAFQAVSRPSGPQGRKGWVWNSGTEPNPDQTCIPKARKRRTR